MIPKYNKIHNRFKLNNSSYLFEEFKEVAYSHIKEGQPFEKIIGDFLTDWLDSKDYVLVNTSGSTGKPKKIKLKKQAMVNSAIATGDFFDLHPGDRALHCLPTNFIAGKMMLVRAMILGLELDLAEPTSQPIFDYEVTYDFCAMIPMQLQKTISYCHNIKTIIVGGAPVSAKLLEAIQKSPASIFETYGMTETITHIAVKQLNNFGSANSSAVGRFYFKTLPNTTLIKDSRNCLVIEVPNISKEKIITNDVVKLHSETEFEWLGRFDSIINSGGLKLNPEQIEKKLESEISERFFIASEPDTILGEQVILVLEAESYNIKASMYSKLEKHEIPKKIYAVPKFIETDSGKIQRKKIMQLLNNKS